MAIKNEILDELLKDKDPKTIFSSEGLLGELKKAPEDARMNCKTHDPPGALIHEDHDPVTAQEQRFATKEIEAPETILGVPEER